MQYMYGPQYSGMPMDMYGAGNNMQFPMQQQPQLNPAVQQQMMQQMAMQQQQQRQKMEPIPRIVVDESKKLFTVIDNKTSAADKQRTSITIENLSDGDKKKRGRKSSPNSDKTAEELMNNSSSTALVPANSEKQTLSGTIEDVPTSYTYYETTGLLKETLGQIDAINGELVKEFTAVKNNRTMKNKYNVLVGLSENIGSLISNRIATIREINSSISKSNDLDYKKYKDTRAAEASVNDDKYIADLYQAFIKNPGNMAPQPQMPMVDTSIFGSGIVRADITGDINSSGPVDAGYLSYMTNLSPEQNMMRYEGNPNVKQVVVYDAATGNRTFQMMDMSTGTAIPNVPVYDAMFLEDTTIDLKSGIAKNLNLNETFPVIVINDDVTSQY